MEADLTMETVNGRTMYEIGGFRFEFMTQAIMIGFTAGLKPVYREAV